MLRSATQRPKNNANHGYQEKMFIAWKVCDFVGKVEMSLYRKIILDYRIWGNLICRHFLWARIGPKS